MKLLSIMLFMSLLAVSGSAAAESKYRAPVLSVSVYGYSHYTLYVNGYEIADAYTDGTASGFKQRQNYYLKKGENTLTVVAQKGAQKTEDITKLKFQIQLGDQIGPVNTADLLNINPNINGTFEAKFKVKDAVFKNFWDSSCSNQSVVLGLHVALNNAFASGDVEKIKQLQQLKMQKNAELHGTSMEAEQKELDKMIGSFADGDLKPLDQHNYKDHVKFDAIKSNELYQVQSYFTDSSNKTHGISSTIGCVHGKPAIVF